MMHFLSLLGTTFMLFRAAVSPQLRRRSMRRVMTLVGMHAGHVTVMEPSWNRHVTVMTLVGLQAGYSAAYLVTLLLEDYQARAGALFGIISGFRWAAAGYILILTIDQARAARWYASQQEVLIANSEWLKASRPQVPEATHAAVSLLLGVVMTVPWVAPLRVLVFGQEWN